MFSTGHQGEGDDWGHPYTEYPHLFSGNWYAAQYFLYQFSNMCAIDIFDSFFKNDVENKEAGRKYRRAILEQGGVDKMFNWEVLRKCLGRDPQKEPFYRWLAAGSTVFPHHWNNLATQLLGF